MLLVLAVVVVVVAGTHEMEMKRQKEERPRVRQMRCVQAPANKKKSNLDKERRPAGSPTGSRELKEENPVSRGGYRFNAACIHNGLSYFCGGLFTGLAGST